MASAVIAASGTARKERKVRGQDKHFCDKSSQEGARLSGVLSELRAKTQDRMSPAIVTYIEAERKVRSTKSSAVIMHKEA